MSPSLDYEMVAPTPDDFSALAATKDLAFAEKRSCGTTAADNQKVVYQAYETYARQYPQKMQHCRILKGIVDGKTIVYGACQLQMPGDPGDFCFTDPSWRHALLPQEAYVEFIATHPDFTGQGLGSKLLAWAFEFCENYRDDNGMTVNRLTLDVMSANKGAVRLYERKGFVAQRCNPHENVCDMLFTPCCLFFGMGCKYCSITYMEKPIVSKTAPEMERE